MSDYVCNDCGIGVNSESDLDEEGMCGNCRELFIKKYGGEY